MPPRPATISGAAITFFQRLDKIEKEEEAGQEIQARTGVLDRRRVDRLRIARKWVALAEKDNTTLMYNRDKYQSMEARLPHGEPAEKGVIQGNHYTNEPFGLSLDVPDGWKLDNARVTGIVGFVGLTRPSEAIYRAIGRQQNMGKRSGFWQTSSTAERYS